MPVDEPVGGLDLLPSVHVEGAALDLVELSIAGLLGGQGFPGRSELADALLPVALPVPEASVDRVRDAARVVLEDAEGVQVAVVDVTELWQAADGSWYAAGPVTGHKPLTHGAFRRLRLTPEQLRASLGDRPRLVVATDSPLGLDVTARLSDKSAGAPVVVLALVGAGRRPYPDAVGLVQALRAGLADLPAGSVVVPVPLPRLDDPAADARLVDAVARAYGGSDVVVEAAGDPAALDRLLGSATAGDRFGPAVLGVLRAHRPPPSRRGVVLLLSGLSGSGKSTVAKGVEGALVESGARTVTFLDGDVVRRHLSKGLGFSKADRDLNVRRIGFVAAEVARHGGVAICAPIAPYAATRAAVRDMVTAAGGTFLLVHVATPIEVCEARDRKGLYALARAGKIPEFTGVSDPYEEPEDADLRLDTSVQDVGTAVDAVLDLLRTGGFLPAVGREEA
jgi:sulfate adenylyltransferase